MWIVFTVVLTREICAQNIEPAPTGRLDEIQAQRLRKLGSLAPGPTATAQDSFNFATYLLHHMTFEVNGLGTGHGPAIGSAFQWNRYADRVALNLWGNIAVHEFYTVGTGFELRNFSKHDGRIALEATHSDAPQLDYYGPGPNSSVNNQTNFRLEETLFNLRASLREHRHYAQACRLGELLLNVGPGTNDDLPTTQSVFGPIEAPGIDTQSNYLIGGCSGEVDWRDVPTDPHKGTYAAANFNRYQAQGHDEFSFNRLSIAAEQYIPFFNRKRVIALRGATELSYHGRDQVVPFYLQPTLGSDTELRGYPRYRFYDENSLALTVEYRWEIGAGLDMAVFDDSGTVFHRPGQISLHDLKNSVGFGLRLKNRRNEFARLDFGFSREGFQVWFKFATRL
jgi:outer membrane protein assembly factor BamA